MTSPINFKTSTTSTTTDGGYKVTEQTSTYRSSSKNYVVSDNLMRNSPNFLELRKTASPSFLESRKTASPIFEESRHISSPAKLDSGVDYSSNIKVRNTTPSRRDSWDVINKTKHILSHNSLESLANMTESQLNTDLSNRTGEVQNLTEKNTQYNKFSLSEAKSNTLDKTHNTTEDYDRHRFGSSSNAISKSNYSTATKQKNEKFMSYARNENDYGYSALFCPIEDNAVGAQAIRVQNIPDGVLGRPVEFQSNKQTFS